MPSSQIKILVVDDNPTDREFIARLLQPKYAVVEAGSVAEGLDVLRHERPDCVLLDHYLPNVFGLDALGSFSSADAVVIMMTGAGNDELAAEAFKRGARDFLLKSAMTGAVLNRVIGRELEGRRLELALSASQKRFDEVAARIPEVLWVRSLDGEFLYLSPSFESVWGKPRGARNNEAWENAIHPDDRARRSEVWQRVISGEEYESSFRILRPNGEVRQILNRGYPIFEEGRIARVGGIARDVTDEARLQQELRLAQKLEAIGQLAAGIAHEINTPAQYVSDNITFLAESIDSLLPAMRTLVGLADGSAEPTREDLRRLAAAADIDYLTTEMPAAIEQSAAGIEQIKKIVLAMKEFSHPSQDVQLVDLNKAVRSTVTVAKNEWKYVADVDFDLDAELPFVQCYPSEINQVILNLLVNAAHAIGDVAATLPDGRGKITVRTRVQDEHVVLDITDTGCGIPPAIRNRIFDPFFTTKEVGKGTGQGLAITHRIVVEHHGGSIGLVSEVGQGTTFSVRLPLRQPRADTSAQPDAGQRDAAERDRARAAV